VICALLGTPRHDWKLFSDGPTDIKKISMESRADEAGILNAWQALDDYLEDMIAHRRHTLTDDLISELIRAEDDGHKTRPRRNARTGRGPARRGHRHHPPPTGRCRDLLCDHPDQWALLGEQPELVPRAVEEAMRYRPIGFGLPRIATEDVELAGVRIPSGTIVLANTAAANRDPAAFSDPDRFDITRDNTVCTLSFGSGRTTAWVHTWPGSNSAKR